MQVTAWLPLAALPERVDEVQGLDVREGVYLAAAEPLDDGVGGRRLPRADT